MTIKDVIISIGWNGPRKHAQLVMDELGITYDRAFASTVGEYWRFIDCKNIPDKLPKYAHVVEVGVPPTAPPRTVVLLSRRDARKARSEARRARVEKIKKGLQLS